MHPHITYELHRQDMRHRLERSLARPDDRSARPRAHGRSSARDDARGRPPDPPRTAPDPPASDLSASDPSGTASDPSGTASDPSGTASDPTGATPRPVCPADGRTARPAEQETPARSLVAVAP